MGTSILSPDSTLDKVLAILGTRLLKSILSVPHVSKNVFLDEKRDGRDDSEAENQCL